MFSKFPNAENNVIGLIILLIILLNIIPNNKKKKSDGVCQISCRI